MDSKHHLNLDYFKGRRSDLRDIQSQHITVCNLKY